MAFFRKKYQDKSDEQLMRLVQQGQSAAMHEIYTRYRDALYGFFFKLLGQRRSMAEDFTHDLFEKVCRQALRFEPERSFRTWLYTLAHNMVKNEYRRRDRQSRRDVHTGERVTYVTEELIDVLDHAYYQEWLEQAIARLPIPQQTCLLLRFRENMSLLEISKVIGCPEGTVKSRLHHALRKLREDKQKIEL